MSQSNIVVEAINLKAGSLDIVDQVAGIEHFAVAVGHGGEVQTDLCEAVRGGFKCLSVP